MFLPGLSQKQTTDCLLYLHRWLPKRVPFPSLRGSTEHNAGRQSNLSSRVLILEQPQDLRGLTCPMKAAMSGKAYLKEVATISARLTTKYSFCRPTYSVLNVASAGSVNSPTVGCSFLGDGQCSLCSPRLKFGQVAKPYEMREEEKKEKLGEEGVCFGFPDVTPFCSYSLSS